ncbi:MAG: hypothetical protein JW849_07735 [Phycisphaerae bacterium]|nr:hypothetical protein [Phycisphaerae bacterium]
MAFMRRTLTLGVLALGLAVVVLAESDDDGGSIRGLVDGVLKEFNKACSDADRQYNKAISPVIRQHNLKRVSRIHSAGKVALQKLRNIAADARKNESPVGEALAKDGMTYVDKIMEESETPLSAGEVWRAKFQGHRYLAVLAPVSWDQAAGLCKKMGGSLVCLETNEEMQFVQKLTGGVAVYVGATDKQKEGDWRWLNRRRVSRSLWAPHRPLHHKSLNEAFLSREGLLDTTAANPGVRGFVCEWSK